jgi:hypothetical protein
MAHKTAICRNPPIHNFIKDKKKKTSQILNRPAFKHDMFLRKYK